MLHENFKTNIWAKLVFYFICTLTSVEYFKLRDVLINWPQVPREYYKCLVNLPLTAARVIAKLSLLLQLYKYCFSKTKFFGSYNILGVCL